MRGLERLANGRTRNTKPSRQTVFRGQALIDEQSVLNSGFVDLRCAPARRGFHDNIFKHGVSFPDQQAPWEQNFLAGFYGQEFGMKKARFTESRIVAILKEADARMPVDGTWRKLGISSATRYGGTEFYF